MRKRARTERQLWILAVAWAACGGDAATLPDGGADTAAAASDLAAGDAMIPASHDSSVETVAPTSDAAQAVLDAISAPDSRALDAASADGPPESAATVCSAMARALCDRFAACAPLHFAQKYPSSLFCRAAVGWECELNLRAPGVNWTPAQARSCAQATSAMSCDAWFSAGLDATCAVGEGRLRDGARCSAIVERQCGRGSQCTGFAADGCGTCKPALPVGADCSQRTDGCVREGVCVVEIGGAARCEGLVDLGAACDARNNCRDPGACPAGRATCVSAVGCRGTCVPASARLGEDCRARPCDPRRALTCNATTFRCEIDTACTGSVQMSGCPGRTGFGKACDRDADCLAPLVCDGKVCAFPALPAACGGP